MIVKTIHYEPKEELSARMDGMSKEEFFPFAADILSKAADDSKTFPKESEATQTLYRQLYEKAIDLGIEDSFTDLVQDIENTHSNEKVTFWALPKPLKPEVRNYDTLSLDGYPDTLRKYLDAVCKSGQSPKEMCILPLLSTLATCVQGKCKVKQHYSSFSHELTLYTLTVAPSGNRKSPALNYFTRALIDYQTRYNDIHEVERKQRATERLFLENKRKAALSGRNANVEVAKDIDRQLADLPPIESLSLYVTDITPEALAQAMSEHGDKMAILDAEGGVLKVVAGMYNGGAANVDLLLEAFDGEPVEIRRKTTGSITLKRPLLSIGLLTQPDKFQEFINNRQFMGNGFIHRFLFSFCRQNIRYSDTAPDIPKDIKEKYYDMVNRLLSMPESDTVITHDRESQILFHDLHEYIQNQKQQGGIFEYVPSYAEKQLANALKIAAILHLCEHEPTEPISGKTAQAAINTTMWLFNQAIQAFDYEAAEDPVLIMANRIIEKLFRNKQPYYALRDIRSLLHVKADNEYINEAMELLIDCYYLRDNGKRVYERGFKARLNPIITAK